MLTLSLVDIERLETGVVAQDLLIKRAIGFTGERVRYAEGQTLVLPAGSMRWLDMAEFQNEYDIDIRINRLTDPSDYPLLQEALRLNAWTNAGLLDDGEAGERLSILNNSLRSRRNEDNVLVSTYDRLQGDIEFNQSLLGLYPGNPQLQADLAKQQNGWYVPESRILPIGDNRDDSRDGRYFGPVLRESILGRAALRFWPPRALQ